MSGGCRMYKCVCVYERVCTRYCLIKTVIDDWRWRHDGVRVYSTISALPTFAFPSQWFASNAYVLAIAHRSTQAYEYYAHIHIDREKETIRSSWRRLKDSQHCALCSRKSKHLPGSGQSVYHDAEFMLLRILLRDICIRKCIWQISLCRLMSGT